MKDVMEIRVDKTTNSKIAEVDFDNLPFGKIFSDHMFVMDYANGEWKDLRITPYQNIEISPANSTLHYGQTIFEGLKAYKAENGEILVFRPGANLDRLNKSAQRMCMPEIPKELFIEALKKLIDIDRAWVPGKEGQTLYIRPFMFATDEFIGIRPSDTYRFIIFTCPVANYYNKPVRVKIEEHYSRAGQGGLGFAKTAANYAASLYPAKQAQKQGYDQLIWTNSGSHEFIEESGTMNVMFRINDTLITPASNDSILRSITRMSVVEIAKHWGYKVEERKVSVDEVIAAIKDGSLKEAFGLGTAATVAHIESLSYRDEDFDLPPIEQREFSNKVADYLNAYKRGLEEDVFAWNIRV
ncbi:branched-chain amino acid aminotransferase [Luteibaculum oceani]|uniref:branched-chain-amino-acid transaminase n=1 Tax=Luteibaculum oceani TaxID=1294296 RepID=A0A5C6UUF9_9FLAO|nr:branched-chain amino acid aminotransferase [Luteibaculum oceani]TXC76234.1 branched-chain amino acid aminotransferase [Luteibaculum oceani]